MVNWRAKIWTQGIWLQRPPCEVLQKIHNGIHPREENARKGMNGKEKMLENMNFYVFKEYKFGWQFSPTWIKIKDISTSARLQWPPTQLNWDEQTFQHYGHLIKEFLGHVSSKPSGNWSCGLPCLQDLRRPHWADHAHACWLAGQWNIGSMSVDFWL